MKNNSVSVDSSMLKAAGPLSADASTVNVHDSRMYCSLAGPLGGLVRNILCDPAYDDDSSLYQFSSKRNLRLIILIKRIRARRQRELSWQSFTILHEVKICMQTGRSQLSLSSNI